MKQTYDFDFLRTVTNYEGHVVKIELQWEDSEYSESKSYLTISGPILNKSFSLGYDTRENQYRLIDPFNNVPESKHEFLWSLMNWLEVESYQLFGICLGNGYYLCRNAPSSNWYVGREDLSRSPVEMIIRKRENVFETDIMSFTNWILAPHQMKIDRLFANYQDAVEYYRDILANNGGGEIGKFIRKETNDFIPISLEYLKMAAFPASFDGEVFCADLKRGGIKFYWNEMGYYEYNSLEIENEEERKEKNYIQFEKFEKVLSFLSASKNADYILRLEQENVIIHTTFNFRRFLFYPKDCKVFVDIKYNELLDRISINVFGRKWRLPGILVEMKQDYLGYVKQFLLGDPYSVISKEINPDIIWADTILEIMKTWDGDIADMLL